MNLADIQKYISLIVEAYLLEQSIAANPASIVTALPKLQALYDEIKALVSTHQAAAEDMAATIASNQAVLVDNKPVPVPPVTPPTPGVDPYSVVFLEEATAKAVGKAGDKIYDTHLGYFRLVYGGAGGVVNPTWTLVETIT